jgi:MtN3 and saliva related transmembrane protein
MTDLIGYIAGTCTTIAFLPQVLRTMRSRDVGGIDLRMFVIFAAGVAMWLAYGIATRSAPVTLFNAVTLVLVCIQIAMIVRLRRAAR